MQILKVHFANPYLLKNGEINFSKEKARTFFEVYKMTDEQRKQEAENAWKTLTEPSEKDIIYAMKNKHKYALTRWCIENRLFTPDEIQAEKAKRMPVIIENLKSSEEKSIRAAIANEEHLVRINAKAFKTTRIFSAIDLNDAKRIMSQLEGLVGLKQNPYHTTETFELKVTAAYLDMDCLIKPEINEEKLRKQEEKRAKRNALKKSPEILKKKKENLEKDKAAKETAARSINLKK